jgi:glyoxylase-like metal-dependent hydrolase (beta-lactamase superfamily II)
MKPIAPILVTLCLFLIVSQHDLSAQPAEPLSENNVVLKWLGTAGWEIHVGQTTILIDPFLTRKAANPEKEWKSDEEAVLSAITRADYILAGHSHADHSQPCRSHR